MVMKLVNLEFNPLTGEVKHLVVERNDGTIVGFGDTGFKTLDANLKRARHYDWKDLEVMNDAICKISDVRKKKQ
jgi:hypothetical protein